MPAKTMEEIADQLKRIRFRHKLFGGVSEDSVWRVLEKLQREYRSVMDAQRIGYEALLDERDAEIYCLQQQLYGPQDGGTGYA